MQDRCISCEWTERSAKVKTTYKLRQRHFNHTKQSQYYDRSLPFYYLADKFWQISLHHSTQRMLSSSFYKE